ncbi:MAG: (Fe-S)-binding protein [Gammaproteobacteria bacterium]
MTTKSANFGDIRDKIRENADKCVKCALCLPHCPTYLLTREEGESPRGRLSLMTAIADSRLGNDPTTRHHLANCLDCRACEAVCPANVPYGTVLADTRSLQASLWQPHESLLTRTSTRVSKQALFRQVLAILASTGTLRLLSRLPGVFGRLLRGLPTSFPRAPNRGARYTAKARSRGTVALFLGCSATSLDTQTLQDSITILTAAGFEVVIPAGQVCCGALAAHAGRAQESRALFESNNLAFLDDNFDAVIVTATGCAAYFNDLANTAEKSLAVTEICQFLLDTRALDDIRFNALRKTVALHTPCTARNILRNDDCTRQLMNYLPGIRITEPMVKHCCGAAGSYFLDHADTATELAQQLLNSLHFVDSDMLCTTNYGCGMHLRAQLAITDGIEVLHPVSLLARQLSATD